MPEFAGILILGALGVGEAAAVAPIAIFGITTGLSAASIVGGAVLLGGSIGLQLLTAKKPNAGVAQAVGPGPALPPPDAGNQPLQQAIASRIVGYGTVRLAGAYVLFEAQTGISYDVIAFHHGPIAAIRGYYLHDDAVTLDGSGFVVALPDGRYGTSQIKIKTRLGATPETAYSEITTPLSTIWTSAHRGDGLASLAMICAAAATPSDFANTYPRGLPLPSVVADCTPIYDPRLDVSLGGTQSQGDSTTWAVSSNPVLQVIDFLTNSDRGFGFDWDELIAPSLSALMAQADLCDDLVARNDGSHEPRYASNGSFPLDSDPADVVSSIVDTCDGWISQNGDGSLVMTVGVYAGPTVTLTSAHIRGCALQYGVGEEEEINELTIDYTEPALDYKTTPAQPWDNQAAIDSRGRTLSQRLALPWVMSFTQARRLAKRRDARNNAPLRGTLTTTLYGLRALGERWIAIQASDLPDLEDLVIEVQGITIDLLNAACQIKFVSVDPATIDAWDPASEEGTGPTIPAKLVSPAAPVPANLSHFVISNFVYLTFDDPGIPLFFQAGYRVSGGGAYTIGPNLASYNAGPGRLEVIMMSPGPGTWDFELRSVTPGGATSAFCSPITFTLTV